MSELVISYRIEIVGGPFDGAPGMYWIDDGEKPPPEIILMGTCPGDGSCAATFRKLCARRRSKHAYYWLPREKQRPAKTVPYELSESFLEPEGKAKLDAERPGRAVYTIGRLQLPRAPVERELVAAGSSRGGEHG